IVVPDFENTLMHAEESRSKELFTSFDQYLIDEVSEVQKIFKQMEMPVEQHSAAKIEFQTKMENVLKENDRLLTHAVTPLFVKKTLGHTHGRDNVSSSESAPTFAELFEANELKALIQEKDTVILKLKEKIKSSSTDDKERKEKVLVISALKEQLKGKAVLPKAVSLNPIDPALLQVDVV
nr:hypothetical protein [Tanacetum cinerariifolium]